MKENIKKKESIWPPLIGGLIIIYGFYRFFNIRELEETGLPLRLSKLFELIYDFGGSYAILAIFELLGISIVILSLTKQKKTS